MVKLKGSELLAREAYAPQRERMLGEVAAHQECRRIGLGPYAVLQFEDRQSVQQRLHEWLWHSQASDRTIQVQLDALNALIPDGSNLMASLQFTCPDSMQYGPSIADLGGIEACIYAEVEGLGQSRAITESIAVLNEVGEPARLQFLRFEFSPEQIIAVRAGAEFGFGIDDDRMRVAHTLKRASRAALLADFDQPHA